MPSNEQDGKKFDSEIEAIDVKTIEALGNELLQRLQKTTAEFFLERGLSTSSPQDTQIALMSTMAASGYLAAFIVGRDREIESHLRSMLPKQILLDFDRALELERVRTQPPRRSSTH